MREREIECERERFLRVRKREGRLSEIEREKDGERGRKGEREREGQRGEREWERFFERAQEWGDRETKRG